MKNKKIYVFSLAFLLIACTAGIIKTTHEDAKEPTSGDGLSGRAQEIGCKILINPGDSFNQAFNQLEEGETLCLNDGVYRQLLNIPSGIKVRALNDGQAEIDGRGIDAGWKGLLNMHGVESMVRGLKVHHASNNADSCNINGKGHIVRLMSCSHGGKHKHKIPIKVSGEGHLIEDSWFYGEGRYVVQCFKGRNITFRRNVARWDLTAPNFKTEPNAAFSIYNCSDITIENNISLDYGTPETPMKFGADFYGPQNRRVWPEGNKNNYWLGNIAINHSIDTLNRRAFRLDPATPTEGSLIKDFYVRGNGVGIVGNRNTNALEVGSCTMESVDRVGSSKMRQELTCQQPADISTRYVNRQKTKDPLFPWQHEALIKKDMCASGERQSDWCTTTKTLTEYVLNN